MPAIGGALVPRAGYATAVIQVSACDTAVVTPSRLGETWNGLRQALLMLLVGASLAAGTGLIWTTTLGGSFYQRTSVSGIVIAALLVLTGSDYISRLNTLQARAFLGVAPEHEAAYTGRHLTLLGTALFVSLPLAFISSLLYRL